MTHEKEFIFGADSGSNTVYPATVDEKVLFNKVVIATIRGTKDELDKTAVMYENEWPAETYGTQILGDALISGQRVASWGDPEGLFKDIWTVMIARHK